MARSGLVPEGVSHVFLEDCAEPSDATAESQRHELSNQSDKLCRSVSGHGQRDQRVNRAVEDLLVRGPSVDDKPADAQLLNRMSSHTKMTMAEAAVAALAGDRPVFSLGFESGLARVRGSTVTLWIEECYCAWTVDFQVSNGVAVQVDGSRSDEDCTKADPGPEFDTPLLSFGPPRSLNNLPRQYY